MPCLTCPCPPASFFQNTLKIQPLSHASLNNLKLEQKFDLCTLEYVDSVIGGGAGGTNNAVLPQETKAVWAVYSVQKVLGELGREQTHLSHACRAFGMAAWELQGSAGMEGYHLCLHRYTLWFMTFWHHYLWLSLLCFHVHCNHGKRSEIHQ